MNIEGVEVGGKNPCRFVAEVSNSHNGSLVLAFKLIEQAKESGADFVKFQCYTPDELVGLRGDGPAPEPWGSEGWTMRTLYDKAKTPLEWFPLLFKRARDLGIVPFASVFGLESLLTMERVQCPAYKIARMESEDYGLVTAVRSRQKPTLISTDKGREGKSYAYDVEWLYCPPKYPTPFEDVGLPRFNLWGEGYLGLSSHCMDPLLPPVAVARGCKMIEVHFQDSNEPSELEANVSLYPHEFKQMVENVRKVEAMLS